MAAPAWWADAVVYQIYPRSFSDADGDGIGDLAGITSRLDHLVELGVDVIWLSPVYRSPMDDNGYDISDYTEIDPVFGTLADFDDLLAAAHTRGIKLIMDLVVNHTSDEHPWFIESRSGINSAKRDWYWWRPPRAGMSAGEPGAEPTNWGSNFSGPAWTLDQASGEYYLHLFSAKQPDLNWENPEVRAAVYQMMRWWLDRGVDGFRMDVIDHISKNAALPDGVVPVGATYGDGGPHVLCGPRNHEFLAEMHREVFAGRDALLNVAEMPGASVDEAVLFTDPARTEVDMVFSFEHVDLDHGANKWDLRPLDLRDLKATLGRWQTGLAERGWNSLYWSNHDQPRVVSRFGDERRWRELAMANAPFADIGEFRDIQSVNHFATAVAAGQQPGEVLAALRARSRDNARTPVQWDASPHAGFSAGTPWIAVNPDYPSVNAAATRADRASVFHHYRRLIELRHTEPVVALGDFTMALTEHRQVYAFTRRLDGVELLALGNFGEQPQPLNAAELGERWRDSTVLIDNVTNAADLPLDGADCLADLRPWEARVLLLG
ncbi:alpha-glucosidase [soil metagenome]